ncbi:unnamed protein product [Thlaspi arvense]|uniref:Protein FATTY ACID EXPORT 3, chloroplastic n=1 Tax=Thlaspi arvense TaxID=13288 RepID=A0AAU9S5J6_THLAR|nr:unnamed protein product [Thlaspi arvense]
MSIPMELMSIRNPNSSFLHRAHSRPPVTLCAPPSLRFQHLPTRRHFNAPKLAPAVVSCTGLRFGFSSEVLLNRSVVAFAASHEESEQSGVEVGKEKSDIDAEDDGKSQEAWKQTLASFKEQVSKMQSVSSEAYNVNSQKAMTILKDTSEQLRIQAEKAKEELGTKAKEVSEEGREYILKAAEESPSDVKEIVEAFASTEDLQDVSRTQDFHVGIPYGLLLLVGGFISFMVSGSIPAIRFGVILGGALFALSLASLKSQRKGESSTNFLKGQMDVKTNLLTLVRLHVLMFNSYSGNHIFERVKVGTISGNVIKNSNEIYVPGFFDHPNEGKENRTLGLTSERMLKMCLNCCCSGGVLAFYVYKMVSKKENGPNLEDGGEDESSDGFVKTEG